MAAGPGAQQAAGAAVKSIAEGAEAGDNRLENALSLLKENKTAEAAQLLTAVAAYRNLGAIAGLRDPKAAREAYARAMALDPDNAEGLFWDGWFQLDTNNLAAAGKSYRALVRLAGKGPMTSDFLGANRPWRHRRGARRSERRAGGLC